jgi:hypothetical protein
MKKRIIMWKRILETLGGSIFLVFIIFPIFIAFVQNSNFNISDRILRVLLIFIPIAIIIIAILYIKNSVIVFDLQKWTLKYPFFIFSKKISLSDISSYNWNVEVEDYYDKSANEWKQKKKKAEVEIFLTNGDIKTISSLTYSAAQKVIHMLDLITNGTYQPK